jgi:methionyl-tRNA formyltransferase
VRLAYLGTPELAVPPLRALVEAGFDVDVVVTRPDRRRGRGTDLSPSPVKVAAGELGIEVVHRVDDLLDRHIDLGVVVAFGQIIKPHVLAEVPMVNLHFSLLPRWRGAAPVERALLAGDQVTGVCLMEVEEGLDTGAVYRRAEVAIGPHTTLAELRAELVEVGTTMLVDALRDGLGEPTPQNGEVTYAAKLDVDELRIDWTRPPEEIDRLVRLGGAWTTFRGRRLRVLAVVVDGGPSDGRSSAVLDGDRVGGLRLLRVQPEGKAPMTADEWLRGARPRPGELLGS